MAVAVLVEFEATEEDFQAVNRILDAENNPQEGGIVHTSAQLADGSQRVFDVWESEEAANRFERERLIPAIAEALGPDSPPPTKREVYELRELTVVPTA